MNRVGIGYDIHRMAAGRKLVLGGVTIPHPVGLHGHSDADALTHAVADALLGAVADGDIGRHFPNTDPRWKDALSLELLKIVAGRVRERGGRIVNVDAMVIAEQPHIAPYVDDMRRNLSASLGIPLGSVSVKATTAEHLGALGRSEGIAVMAVASVDGEER